MSTLYKQFPYLAGFKTQINTNANKEAQAEGFKTNLEIVISKNSEKKHSDQSAITKMQESTQYCRLKYVRL